METLNILLLGIIQGLTEFLPISSSGHLVIFQNLFGMKDPEILLDICLHAGTLISVCIVFYKEILNILKAIISFPRLFLQTRDIKKIFIENEYIKLMALIIVGSIPTGIIGILFHNIVDKIFTSILLVSLMLMITGTLLWFTKIWSTKKWSSKKWLTKNVSTKSNQILDISFKQALIIGVAQGFAILPGISRSGTTIAIALFLGINREFAGKFSFLLSIPAILGALVLELNPQTMHSSISGGLILLGAIVSSVIGLIALKLLLKLVKHGKLYMFAPYCWLLGIISFISCVIPLI